ncbi:MAG: ATP-binding protein [Hyphomonadaceae bacterium]|nr:ATP-binding protein [Hyphomonadaceae bacterium]
MVTLVQSRVARSAGDAQTLLDAMPVLVLGVDVAGRIHFANIAAAEVLAAPAGGLVGRRLADVFGATSTVAAFGRRAAAEAIRLSQADILIEGPTFTLGRADFIAAPVDDPAGAVLTFVPRSASRAATSAHSAPPIARTLAHEVRNPLAGIRAAAQLIGKDATADVRVLTDMICAEADRIRRLTDRIDAFDDLAPPRLALLNIHEALGRAHAVVSATFPSVAIVEAYDPSLPPVAGDMDQLIQVFLNIAKNAAEAVRGRPGGAVTLSTRYRPGVRVRSAGGVARAQMEVAVTDNGPGLSPLLEGRVFEPFATTKADGVGLGLAIAAEIISRHEGRIDVESRPGHTVFRVLLPIAEEYTP